MLTLRLTRSFGMGLSFSYIAARGAGRAAILGALGLAEAGEAKLGDPILPDSKFACWDGEDGWLVVSSRNMNFCSRERVAAASQGGIAVGAYLEEHVMVSGAFGAADGALGWTVQHHCDEAEHHLALWGDPPPGFAAIRAEAEREQREQDDADYIFGIPVDTAAGVCGFNPNKAPGEVLLTPLKVVRPELMKMREPELPEQIAAQAARPPRKPGLLARLFGG